MKILLIFRVVVIYITLFLFSCKKQTTGCTDSTALNYNSSASTNDGSCIYGGNVVFWTNNLSFHYGSITVRLDDGQTTTITVNNTVEPTCASTVNGSIMSVPTGTTTNGIAPSESHTYTTIDGRGAKSSGAVIIAPNTCTQQLLN